MDLLEFCPGEQGGFANRKHTINFKSGELGMGTRFSMAPVLADKIKPNCTRKLQVSFSSPDHLQLATLCPLQRASGYIPLLTDHQILNITFLTRPEMKWVFRSSRHSEFRFKLPSSLLRVHLYIKKLAHTSLHLSMFPSLAITLRTVR